MHIPDGFLDVKTWAGLSLVSAAFVAVAAKKTRASLGERQIPLAGVTAAFVFAAQMVNIPVAGGTSGHFLGAALAAVLLGPWTAVLVMATVLSVQCFVFQDGGVTALGANIFNMGILAPGAGYLAYAVVNVRAGATGKASRAAPIAAGFISIVAASVACALELALSGTVPLASALPALTGIHMVIGIGEGIVTAVVARFVARVRPDLLELEKT